MENYKKYYDDMIRFVDLIHRLEEECEKEGKKEGKIDRQKLEKLIDISGDIEIAIRQYKDYECASNNIIKYEYLPYKNSDTFEEMIERTKLLAEIEEYASTFGTLDEYYKFVKENMVSGILYVEYVFENNEKFIETCVIDSDKANHWNYIIEEYCKQKGITREQLLIKVGDYYREDKELYTRARVHARAFERDWDNWVRKNKKI